MGNLELKALSWLTKNSCPNCIPLIDHFYDRDTLVLVLPKLKAITIQTVKELQTLMRDLLMVNILFCIVLIGRHSNQYIH